MLSPLNPHSRELTEFANSLIVNWLLACELFSRTADTDSCQDLAVEKHIHPDKQPLGQLMPYKEDENAQKTLKKITDAKITMFYVRK